MTSPNAERRPGGGGELTGSGGTLNATVNHPADIPPARCPWLAAALRSGDFKILAAVIRLHPAERCPAARLGRAA